MKQTSTAIGVGSGGSVPHVAVWGEDGALISQFRGEADGHICKGETWQTVVDNYQNGMKPANPSYISVVMQKNDAICVAMISVSGNGQTDYTFEGSNLPIRCAWLDADHTNGIIAKGMSLHIRDFTADSGLVQQYKNNTDRVCKNTARMTFWPDTVPDATVPIFSPPLQYTRNPGEGKDKGNRAYPDWTDLKGWSIGRKKRYAKDSKVRRGIYKTLSETLVVSHFAQHSAREMCGDPMALSSDFASIQEGLFCDMTLRKLWPLCTSTLTTECFDVPNMTPSVAGPHKRSDVPSKHYSEKRP
ncbi:hypothetical protein BU23DRAFT_588384 [Bimuria novae-zelandiae CBS 107.79]|uniref:Uncharacterized protein n=1 Tax=Bimuria novae-zelandiae CBS 107.79 TaxID=1447943 RepID=A0A6A5VGD0_9PLEO|nr:hypothetical protein BU23DRAFT_588384 [Bimuria novae-zelandiae CBS 107.79]